MPEEQQRPERQPSHEVGTRRAIRRQRRDHRREHGADDDSAPSMCSSSGKFHSSGRMLRSRPSCARLPDHHRRGSEDDDQERRVVEPERARCAERLGQLGARGRSPSAESFARELAACLVAPRPTSARGSRRAPRASSAAMIQPSQSWYSSSEIASQTPKTSVPGHPDHHDEHADLGDAHRPRDLRAGLSDRQSRDDHDREHHLRRDERDGGREGGARGSSRPGSSGW